MSFQDICRLKGGVFKKGVGCFLNDAVIHKDLFKLDFPHRQEMFPDEGRRLFYQATKEECEKNGDEMVLFGHNADVAKGKLSDVQACRELGPSEYCKKHGYRNRGETTPGTEADIHEGSFAEAHWIHEYETELAACMSKMQFPDHKLEEFFETRDMVVGDGIAALFRESDFLEVVIAHQKLSSSLINKIIIDKDAVRAELLETLYGSKNGKPYQKLSPGNIDAALEHGLNLRELFENHHNLTQGNITKAIKGEKELPVLYRNHTLNAKNIDIAMALKKELETLFRTQKLTSSQITTAMGPDGLAGHDLAALYEHQSLNQAHVEEAIRKAEQDGQLSGVFKNKKIKLTSTQIEKIISAKWANHANERDDLEAFYDRYVLTPRQVDRALARGVALENLVKKNTFTDAQITKIIKKCEGEELFQIYSKKGALKPQHIDLALGTKGVAGSGNHHYIPMLYQYQTMSPRQINRAIEIGINREAIYEHQILGSEQVLNALKQELNEQENDLQKKKLFTHQKFTNQHIDYIMEEVNKNSDTNTLNIFMERQKNRLNEQHMKEVVNYANESGKHSSHGADEVIEVLFSSQNTDVDIVDYCIKKQVSLELLYESYGSTFKKQNIDNAIALGKHVGILYQNAKLTNLQIINALKKKEEIPALIQSNKSVLNDGHVLFLIKNGSKEDLGKLYETYTRGNDERNLSEKNIDEAMIRGEGLHELYKNTALYGHQVRTAIEKGVELRSLYCNTANNFSLDALKYAIDNNKDLPHLYTCQTNLPPDIIDYAMLHRASLHDLYEHQKLNDVQLTTALTMGIELQQIIDNHLSRFKPEHFDLLIPNADNSLLFRLYRDDSFDLSDEQREMISKIFKDKMGMDIPAMSLVHQVLDPGIWPEYEMKKKRYVDARIPEKPFTHIIGVYPLSLANPWQKIIDLVDKEGYVLSDDGKHAIEKEETFFARQLASRGSRYPIPDNAPRQVIRVGKLIRKELLPEILEQGFSKQQQELAVERHPIMRKFKEMESKHIRPMHFTDATIPKEELDDLEIVITDDPNDIAAKGTGHVHIKDGCETVYSGAFGWTEWTKGQLAGREPTPHNNGCGWCDDIKNNNVIAYLRSKTQWEVDSEGEFHRVSASRKWYDRAMIRWCVREDDKKPDAILEIAYGGEKTCKCHNVNPGIKYKPLFKTIVTNILQANGFSATEDGHKCLTPYHFTGFADSATEKYPANPKSHIQNTIKTYELIKRPKNK